MSSPRTNFRCSSVVLLLSGSRSLGCAVSLVAVLKNGSIGRTGDLLDRGHCKTLALVVTDLLGEGLRGLMMSLIEIKSLAINLDRLSVNRAIFKETANHGIINAKLDRVSGVLDEVLAHRTRVNSGSLLIKEGKNTMGEITREISSGKGPEVVLAGTIREEICGGDVLKLKVHSCSIQFVSLFLKTTVKLDLLYIIEAELGGFAKDVGHVCSERNKIEMWDR